VRALITGVAGFLGSHLAERLVARGATVTGIDALTDFYDPACKRRNLEPLAAEPRFRFLEQSLADADLGPLVADSDVVFHLAAHPGVRTRWGDELEPLVHENTLVTHRLLEAARHSRIARFVFASSSSVYGDAEILPTRETDALHPISPYGVTKLASEGLCRLYGTAFGVPAVALRYFSIYGPRQRPDMAFSRFIDAALDGHALTVYGDGLQSRDFTYVDDAVSATVAAGERGAPGRSYNVAGGSQVAVAEAVATLERLVGRPIAVRHQPVNPGEARHTRADTTAAREDLGYAPRIALEAGLAAQLESQKRIRGLPALA
jgi:nucleoside-diphosphate-sugar epimerase